MQTALNLCRTAELVKDTFHKYGLAYATLYRHIKCGNLAPKNILWIFCGEINIEEDDNPIEN